MRIEDRSQVNELRFVLLHHRMPAQAERKTHWDLMLEQGEALLTLALECLPEATQPGETTTLNAQRLPNHRRAYLDYEGEVSEGRGSVRREAAGVLRIASSQGTPPVMRCKIIAKNLIAEIEFPSCDPGETICLKVLSWNWE